MAFEDTRRSGPGRGRSRGCAGFSAALEVVVTLVPSRRQMLRP